MLSHTRRAPGRRGRQSPGRRPSETRAADAGGAASRRPGRAALHRSCWKAGTGLPASVQMGTNRTRSVRSAHILEQTPEADGAQETRATQQ